MRLSIKIGAILFYLGLFNVSEGNTNHGENKIDHNKDCPDLDYSERFGPVRDQGWTPYCWAFQGAALIEEYLCKIDKNKCGESVSPLDISRCNWGLGKGKGEHPRNALKCALNEGGVCMEEHAPFQNIIKRHKLKLQCLIMTAPQDRSPLCIKDRTFSNIINTTLNILGVLTLSVEDKISTCLKQILIDENTNCKENRQTIEGAKIGAIYGTMLKEYLEEKLESQQQKLARAMNEIERQKLKKVIAETEHYLNFHNFKTPEELMLSIKETLKTGSSVAIGLDLGRVLGTIMSFRKGSNHALIVNGMRYNKERGRCEFQLRNSWGGGENVPFHGWHSIEDLESAIDRISFLKKEGEE